MRMVALGHWHKGKFDIARDIVEQALELYDTDLHRDLCWSFAHDPRSAMLNYKSWALWFQGYPDQATKTIDENVKWARRLGHANTIGLVGCWGVLMTGVFMRDTATVVEEGRKLIDYCDEMAMTLWRAWSLVFVGWAEVIRSTDAEGLDIIEKGLDEAISLGAGRLLPLTCSLAAEAFAEMGNLEQALKYSDRALRETRSHEDVAWLSIVHLIRAQVFHRVSEYQHQANDEFQNALEVARRQGARSMELRTATVLAELWATEGNSNRARDLLLPIYEEFTEGFGTTDLLRARTMLESLDG
jgi:predicted ATPase